MRLGAQKANDMPMPPEMDSPLSRGGVTPPLISAGDPLSALEQAIQAVRQGRMEPEDFASMRMSLAQQMQGAR